MSHQHSHTTQNKNKKILLICIFLITAFMVVEVIGGYMSGSLALIADAGHMLSDAISLLVALIALYISARSSNHQKTYGYKRFEILAAMLNGVTLILISLYIIYEAVQRFRNPSEIASMNMLVIAVIGLVVNIIVAKIMIHGSDVKNNLNMRGAYLHVISDMLGSIAAIFAAVLIMTFEWLWADPLSSIIVSILILRSGYNITKGSIHILMEGTPQNINIDDIKLIITKNKEVIDLHDLHLWTITSDVHVLTCHVVVSDNTTISDVGVLLKSIEHELRDMNIQHATIQVEPINLFHDSELYCHIQESEISDHAH